MNKPSIAGNSNPATPGVIPSIYLTCSPALLDSALLDKALLAVRRAFPGSPVVSAREFWHSGPNWWDEFHGLLSITERLICFTNEDGFLSLGTWLECDLAKKRSIPVALVTAHGELLDFFGPEVLFFDQAAVSDWTRFVRIAHRASEAELRQLYPELPERFFERLQRATGE